MLDDEKEKERKAQRLAAKKGSKRKHKIKGREGL
jgi:hypothetical protein